MTHKILKWTKRGLFGMLLLLVVILITGYFYESSKRKSAPFEHPAPGKMVQAGDHRLHVRLIGQGDFTVIMDAGLGELGSFAFLAVEKQLAQHAKVLLYDRAGCNWSEPSASKRTPEHIAKELHLVVQQLGITGPIILVGHSQGGLNMMQYAAMFREQVKGLVLLDAAHPEAFATMPTDVKEVLLNASGNIGFVNFLAKTGIMRAIMPENALQLPDKIAGINHDSIAILLTSFFPQTMNHCIYPEHKDGVVNHGLTMNDLQLDSLPVRILAATGSMKGPMGAPPGWNDELEKKHIPYWSAMQQGLLALSSNSEIAVLKNSGHGIQSTQPDTVVRTILALIAPHSSMPVQGR